MIIQCLLSNIYVHLGLHYERPYGYLIQYTILISKNNYYISIYRTIYIFIHIHIHNNFGICISFLNDINIICIQCILSIINYIFYFLFLFFDDEPFYCKTFVSSRLIILILKNAKIFY